MHGTTVKIMFMFLCVKNHRQRDIREFLLLHYYYLLDVSVRLHIFREKASKGTKSCGRCYTKKNGNV